MKKMFFAPINSGAYGRHDLELVCSIRPLVSVEFCLSYAIFPHKKKKLGKSPLFGRAPNRVRKKHLTTNSIFTLQKLQKSGQKIISNINPIIKKSYKTDKTS